MDIRNHHTGICNRHLGIRDHHLGTRNHYLSISDGDMGIDCQLCLKKVRKSVNAEKRVGRTLKM